MLLMGHALEFQLNEEEVTRSERDRDDNDENRK